MTLGETSLDDVFDTLTPKQREALRLLADGRTSKEIAFELEISESAAVQRIEGIRSKAGGILRKDLARRFRIYETNVAEPCKTLTGKKFHLPPQPLVAQETPQDYPDPELQMADAMSFKMSAPWAERAQPRVVPKVLEGRGATVYRWAAASVMAAAMAVAMLVLLAVADTLGSLV